MNLIQKNSNKIPFFTSMLNVEKWMGIKLEEFDWHISPTEGGWSNFDDPQWITGVELKNKLKVYDYQFIWSVFSAYPKDTKPFTSSIPHPANSLKCLNDTQEKQLQSSLFEIACWDSSATIFIGVSESLGNHILENAPDPMEIAK